MKNVHLSDISPVAGIVWNDLQYLSVDPGKLTIIRVPSDDSEVLQDVTAKLASIWQEYAITIPIIVVPYSMEFLQIDVKIHSRPPTIYRVPYDKLLNRLIRLWRHFTKWFKDHI